MIFAAGEMFCVSVLVRPIGYLRLVTITLAQAKSSPRVRLAAKVLTTSSMLGVLSLCMLPSGPQS